MYSKIDYLLFEKENYKNMNRVAMEINRKKHKVSNADIKKVYGNNDPIYLK